MTEFLTTAYGARLAYDRIGGQEPGIVFLHGLKSDMQGTKALHLAEWCRAQGRAFLRFDCSGHGASSGQFRDGCIGDWFRDALTVITTLTAGPQILIGSSMGGWLMLLLARAMPERVAGLVGIAAAPDFTEDMLAAMSAGERIRLEREGVGRVPDGPEMIEVSRRLLDDGRRQMVLDRPLPLPFPVRLLQGAEDDVVPVATALHLLEHADCPDMRLTLVKGAGHRFSEMEQLGLMVQAVADVTLAAAG